MASDRLGIWLVGARGSVATTVATGLAALRKKAVRPTGLVTELPLFARCGLADWSQLVLGGHDIRGGSVVETARALAKGGGIDAPLVEAATEDLARYDAAIRPGLMHRSGTAIEALADAAFVAAGDSPRAQVEAVKADLRAFIAENRLDRVAVVLVASTEPATDEAALPTRWRDFEATLEHHATCVARASTLYAVAALELGQPFVNFTPSLGSDCAPLRELAEARRAPHAGRDGKTGETLLKSVLAPMFARRNLEVMSWVGHNILGAGDGRVLDDSANKATKVQSKDRPLGEMLGYNPQTLVSIENVRSLEDWKTAWDHVHFRGFLGATMTLQFTWQGCDSALAAPLVLDLARLALRSSELGEHGALGHLASFFKNPIGSDSHDFATQFETLVGWATRLADNAG